MSELPVHPWQLCFSSMSRPPTLVPSPSLLILGVSVSFTSQLIVCLAGSQTLSFYSVYPSLHPLPASSSSLHPRILVYSSGPPQHVLHLALIPSAFESVFFSTMLQCPQWGACVIENTEETGSLLSFPVPGPTSA